MRVMVLFNPIAGRGKSAVIAGALADRLSLAGHEATPVETRLADPSEWLDPALADIDVVVVAGGDGAVRLAVDSAARLDKPLYHYPLGTENLFARELGTTRSADQLLRALERGRMSRLDVGKVRGQTFLLMVSVGYDAEVVHDLASNRTGGISHLSYGPPMFRRFLRWRPSRLSVRVDDELVVDGQAGFLVVANCRQYARRFDPARRASMSDGRLDVVFLPTRSKAELIRWGLACRTGRHMSSRRLVYRQGEAVEIRSDPPKVYQVDGDPGGDLNEEISDLSLSVAPAKLPVLLP